MLHVANAQPKWTILRRKWQILQKNIIAIWPNLNGKVLLQMHSDSSSLVLVLILPNIWFAVSLFGELDWDVMLCSKKISGNLFDKD